MTTTKKISEVTMNDLKVFGSIAYMPYDMTDLLRCVTDADGLAEVKESITALYGDVDVHINPDSEFRNGKVTYGEPWLTAHKNFCEGKANWCDRNKSY